MSVLIEQHPGETIDEASYRLAGELLREHLPGEHDQKKHGRKGKQTETPEFKKWFGDSKVVDENGEPLVVYHGTPEAFEGEFSFQDLGDARDNTAFFSDNTEVAGGYAYHQTLADKQQLAKYNQAYDDREKLWHAIGERMPDRESARIHKMNDLLDSKEITRVQYDQLNAADDFLWDLDNAPSEDSEKSPNIKPVFLKIKNPLKIDANGLSWQDVVAPALKRADRKKHDGIIFNNVVDNPGNAEFTSTTYAVFSPTQIKSATGNKGTFDPDNPDIRESLAHRIHDLTIRLWENYP